MSVVISQIPRNITITADLDPARRAIGEFLAQNTGGAGASQTITGHVAYEVDQSALDKATRRAALVNHINQMLAIPYNSIPMQQQQIDALIAQLQSGNYSSGGYTGSGGKYEAAGVVHRGEYVVPKEMVNQSTGLPYSDAFGRVIAGYSGGGYVQPATTVSIPNTMMVELSPTDRALLSAVGNSTVTLDGKVLVAAVNGSNTNNARRGSR
jgi:hypothetical protein